MHSLFLTSSGFKLAVRNSQFAKHFSSLWMNFSIFSKNCELLKSDTSWIFRVIRWTSYIQSHFKPNNYPLLNNNMISQRFIVHINFKLHTSFISIILLQSSKLWTRDKFQNWWKLTLTMFTLKQLANHFLNFRTWHSTTLNVHLRLICRLDLCASRSPYS